MTTILDTIFDVKRARVKDLKRRTSLSDLAQLAAATRSGVAPHRLRNAMRASNRINVIAEFKKASPSKGVINGEADPATVGTIYEKAGAVAISVLTEEDHFRGSLDDLRAMRAVVEVPILRKDFTFDEFQIYEAAAAGSDAILLIVSMLGTDRLRELRSLAEGELGLDALVEVHTREEMERAVDAGSRLIGVNNRDLRTFEVSLDVSRELVRFAPPDATLVAESGLRTRDDLVELRSVGYSGFLIGEALMRSDDPENELRKLSMISSA